VADEINFTDITAMLNQNFAGPGTFWFAGHDTKQSLMELTDDSGRLIWKQSLNEGVTGNLLQGTLAGIPIVFTEDAPAFKSAGDLQLISPEGMLLGDDGDGIRFAESFSFYFDRNAMAFRWVKRCGGQPTWDSTYTPRNGGLALSHFTSLATV